MNSKIILATLATSLALVSCGSDTKKKAENTYIAPKLQNDWAGGCEALTFVPLSASAQVSFEALNFHRTLYMASDAGCKTQDVEVVYAGEYKVADPNDQQKAINAVPIDLAYKSVSVKPMTQTGVDIFNTLNFCGHKDWAVNVPVDVTAMSTAAGCPLNDLPQIQYDIVSTEGGILRFGATGIKEAPLKVEERPTELKGPSFNEK